MSIAVPGMLVDPRPALTAIIHAYGLHRQVPVGLIDVLRARGWIVRVAAASLAPLSGYALIVGDTKLVRVSPDASRAWRRVVCARALVAECRGRAGFLPSSPLVTRAGIFDVAVAGLILPAAELLIPDATLDCYSDPRALAVACDVPPELAAMRLRAHVQGGPAHVLSITAV